MARTIGAIARTVKETTVGEIVPPAGTPLSGVRGVGTENGEVMAPTRERNCRVLLMVGAISTLPHTLSRTLPGAIRR